MNRYILYIFYIFFISISCYAQDTIVGTTMGTTYSIKINGINLDEKERYSLKNKIDKKLFHLNHLMSTYKDNSLLSIFNSTLNMEYKYVGKETINVIICSLKIAKYSNNVFNVTLGEEIDSLGFDKTIKELKYLSKKTAIKKIKKIHKLKKLKILPLLLKKQENIYLNLSGIAKGYGVDLIYNTLKRLGYKSFNVYIGGEFRGTTLKDMPLWNIGLVDPRYKFKDINLGYSHYSNEIFGMLKIRNGSLATSGSYFNYFKDKGLVYSHLFKKNNSIIEDALISVTLLASNCMIADALSTTAFVLKYNKFKNLNIYLKKINYIYLYMDKKGQYLKISKNIIK